MGINFEIKKLKIYRAKDEMFDVYQVVIDENLKEREIWLFTRHDAGNVFHELENLGNITIEFVDKMWGEE